jgi:hypothetical protein
MRNYLTNGLIWNSILSFLTESYMLMAISTITNLRDCRYNSFGTFLSSNLAFIGLIVLIGLPIFVLFFLLKKSKQLRLRRYKNKFGTLYAELNYNYIWKDKVVLLEPFFNLMRVLLLTLSLLLLKDFRYF